MFPLARAAGDAIIFCKAGWQTRHWRKVGDEQFEAMLEEGKTTSCVWVDRSGV
jgi:hypothetical protein